MAVKSTLLITLFAVGVACVAGSGCGVANVSQCYNNLVHYEGLGFPLYGEDALELDETCRTMNESFDCLNNYVATCHESKDCDEDCAELLTDIGVFSLNTGLRDLEAELCNPNSAIRETYLENYVCLDDNANSYASCHNDSQLSQEFMTQITDPQQAVNARCCFFSWYQDCFVNITRDTCGVNATFFVSFSLHKLIGHIATLMCQDKGIVCDRPPLASHDLDGDKPDVIDHDIDNSVDELPTGASESNRASIVFHVSWSLFYICFMKRLFK